MYKQFFNSIKKHLTIAITVIFLATITFYGKLRSTQMSQLGSLFNPFRKNGTTNASNQSLAAINGSCNLSGIQLSNTLINGSANLGKETTQTIFSEIIVVNGSLKAQHASFETLEVNGSAKLDSCTIANKGEFSGSAKLTNCELSSLDLNGKDFILKDCTVSGDIVISSIMGKGKLILDNTIVEGSATFIEDNGDIIITNGSHIKKS
ncbi:MAG: hypothetical protein P4L31_02645 [Candidatus Babeliales bacterium]|nr:hypothetical protein [Candidatus Babeliales bacterium]